jgi:ubiquitin-conjugating enzyme E2 Q
MPVWIYELRVCLVLNIADIRLGPSVEHVIKTQPGVVDLLLTFAHAAASTETRMDLPLLLQYV